MALDETDRLGGAPIRIVRRFRVRVVAGPDAGTEREVEDRAKLAIGTDPSNDLVLSDRTVSRFHCELTTSEHQVTIRDLGSSNGTRVDGVGVREGVLDASHVIMLGTSRIAFRSDAHDEVVLPSSRTTQFGGLLGRSATLRVAIAQLEKAAVSDATILLDGETGTGKGATAEAVHEMSGRRRGPFVVADCSAMPATLLESELFGHERGAFTGAVATRPGAFEQAHRGTIFIDEIGELPLPLQPKLLRVLEARAARRVGGSAERKFDVRIIAATNRDLRSEVNAGRFREDLYFRLAVVRVTLPPLRDRAEDVAILANHFLDALGASPATRARLLTGESLARMRDAPWPGNVRELRNYVERAVVLESVPELDGGVGVPSTSPMPDAAGLFTLPFADARGRILDQFERAYLLEMLKLHDGRAAAAAAAAGVHRVNFYRMLRRHGIRAGSV